MDRRDFTADAVGLAHAVDSLCAAAADGANGADDVAQLLPAEIPAQGIGPVEALDALAPLVVSGARDLGAPGFLAHMDPPTPWITWAATMWAASRNQNLLHPDTAPVARELEARVVAWLSPLFGMGGGHLVPGSTIANLTALWAAREAGATSVVSSASAHLSVLKAAHLLGLPHRSVDDWASCGEVSDAVVVITAGATSTGAIERLDAAPEARWRHVDAAWAGPLRLSDRHAASLDGIETAHSVAVSAHKWLFQPKESALVLFRDVDSAHRSISVGGDYLTVPNIGLLGSHGATAVPLLATLLAFGRHGLAELIDRSMSVADELYTLIDAHADLQARTPPQSGVVNWRHRRRSVDEVRGALDDDVFVSSTLVDDEPWLRSVAANPFADPTLVVERVLEAARRCE